MPGKQENGYLFRTGGGEQGTINQIVVAPIASSETGEAISALLVGFEPTGPNAEGNPSPILNGIWLGDSLHLPALGDKVSMELEAQVRRSLPAVVPQGGDDSEQSFTAQLDGSPVLVFWKRLNPGSIFPTAYEVCVLPARRVPRSAAASALADQRSGRDGVAGRFGG